MVRFMITAILGTTAAVGLGLVTVLQVLFITWAFGPDNLPNLQNKDLAGIGLFLFFLNLIPVFVVTSLGNFLTWLYPTP